MPIGKKQIFLPNFTIGLFRNKHLPPNYAQFLVPLTFNKFDLKDYLLHAYNVKCLSVRSYVIQQKVQRIKDMKLPRKEQFRPRAIKKMTVELEVPFVYPEEPKDLSAWDNELYKAMQAAQEERQRMGQPGMKERMPDQAQRKHIFELARSMLGFDQEEKMEEIEVEKDIDFR